MNNFKNLGIYKVNKFTSVNLIIYLKWVDSLIIYQQKLKRISTHWNGLSVK